jgi:hypothetical protein
MRPLQNHKVFGLEQNTILTAQSVCLHDNFHIQLKPQIKVVWLVMNHVFQLMEPTISVLKPQVKQKQA